MTDERRYSEIHGAGLPQWTGSEPEPWEARAVNLSKCSNREKNRAWRRLKQDAPDVTDAIAEHLPALRAHFPGATVYVDADYLEEND